ncbi:NAD(P)-dependent oxidoreductase [bacterium]|nr:NAD(P)-dependent oxidoreductase [bacterium]
MRTVITGGGGFLGFHLSRGISGEQTLLDIAPFRDVEDREGIKRVVGDIRDIDLLRDLFKDADQVIHGAAALPLWKPAEIRDVNEQGTATVLQAALDVGVRRVVHISSTAVYGIPDHHPLTEEDEMVGVGPYGESKVVAELICSAFRKKGLFVAVVRPKTFIGPERLGVFQILFDWVREGRKIPVIGNGENRYQLLDVADLVSAVQTLLNCPIEEGNSTFNVGAERFGTVKSDLGELFAHAGTGSRILPTHAGFAKGMLAVLEAANLSPLYKWVYGTADQDSWVSIEKLKALGWQPQHSNAETMKRTYDWYLDNLDALQAPGTGHRVPWREGALSIIRHFL